MKASRFEIRHPVLLHLLIAGAAFSVYVVDPDDIVWRFIRHSPSARPLEHVLFCVATLFIGTGAILATRAHAFVRPMGAERMPFPAQLRMLRAGHLGEWLYAVGLSSLAPLWGSALLIICESIRILRLAACETHAPSGTQRPKPPYADRGLDLPTPRWALAFRLEAVKWGVFLTMIAFTITLIDRVADYGVVASVLIWVLWNLALRGASA